MGARPLGLSAGDLDPLFPRRPGPRRNRPVVANIFSGAVFLKGDQRMVS